MSNRNADTVLDTFANVYRLCRLNRGNIHFRHEFFRFRGGSIFIGEGGSLVIKRDHSTLNGTFYSNMLLNGPVAGAYSRRYWLARSRECAPVRLP